MIHSIWTLSVLYHISTYFPLFWSLFPLQHTCNCLNKPTSYRWTFTLSIHWYLQYIFFLWTINRNYSLLLFYYTAYSANNTGKHCVFVIYRHKGRWSSLIFIILLFCLSCQKHIQDITSGLFIIGIHFVESLVWYRSVFNQYSYYCDFFFLGPA